MSRADGQNEPPRDDTKLIDLVLELLDKSGVLQGKRLQQLERIMAILTEDN